MDGPLNTALGIGVLAGLLYILYQNKKIMANQERAAAALQTITEATTGIAADIRELKEKAAREGVSEETLAGLEAAATKLQAMDGENPSGERAAEAEGGETV